MIPIEKKLTIAYKSNFATSITYYVDNRSTKYDLGTINASIITYFGGIVSNLHELILADASILRRLKNHCDSNPTQANGRKSAFDFDRLYDIFKENESSKQFMWNGNFYCSNNHFKKLGVEVCPYCNQFPVLSFTKNVTGEGKRDFDWDHVYPKSIYPFLAVSIHNLVPSCKACNLTKKDRNRDFMNPFNSYSVNDLLTFDIDIIKSNYLDDSVGFNIIHDVASSADGLKMSSNLEEVALIERYNEIKEIARLCLNQKRKYNTPLFKGYRTLFALFGTEADAFDVRQMFFSVPETESEYGKVPYSKLINDVIDSDH
jgi:hypothetical protein